MVLTGLRSRITCVDTPYEARKLKNGRGRTILSEERTITTGVKRLAVGAAAVAMLAVFGGVAYAQQGGNQQAPAQQAPGAQEGGQDRGDCPWGHRGGEGESQQQTEV